MTDRPILFSAPMVRALLAGRKTQTRRILLGTALAAHEPQWDAVQGADGIWRLVADTEEVRGQIIPDVRYSVGDRLWVRENIAVMPRTAHALPKTQSPVDPDVAAYYQADFDRSGKPRWSPSIHMPRWASRLTLIVAHVRVQRLQDISEADAISEGAISIPYGSPPGFPEREAYHHGQKLPPPLEAAFETAKDSFRNLWNGLNAARGFGWLVNPWIVAVTFGVEQRNIDEVA